MFCGGERGCELENGGGFEGVFVGNHEQRNWAEEIPGVLLDLE